MNFIAPKTTNLCITLPSSRTYQEEVGEEKQHTSHSQQSNNFFHHFVNPLKLIIERTMKEITGALTRFLRTCNSDQSPPIPYVCETIFTRLHSNRYRSITHKYGNWCVISTYLLHNALIPRSTKSTRNRLQRRRELCIPSAAGFKAGWHSLILDGELLAYTSYINWKYAFEYWL